MLFSKNLLLLFLFCLCIPLISSEPSPSPFPSVAPTPTPSPSNTPTPSPSPSVAPTPTPSPSTAPIPSPSPAPSLASPSPAPSPDRFQQDFYSLYSSSSSPSSLISTKGNKSPSSLTTYVDTFPEVNAIVYLRNNDSSLFTPSPSLLVHDCKFTSVAVDGNKRSGRMVRVIAGGFVDTSPPIVTLEDCEFTGLDGFSALFFNVTTEESIDSDDYEYEMEANIIDTLFTDNKQNNSESLIYFDLSSTKFSSFNVSINATSFVSNEMQLLGGPLPYPSQFLFQDSLIEGNHWMAGEPASKGEQLPFYFFDVVRPAQLVVAGLTATLNVIDNVDHSSTDPEYFSILHVDSYDTDTDVAIDVILTESYFARNTNCTAMLVTGSKTLNVDVELSDSVFEWNDAAVTVGVGMLASTDESSLILTNLTFVNNSYANEDLLDQWGETGDLIFCGGKGTLTVEGDGSLYEDNGESLTTFRSIDGTCKKMCLLSDDDENLELCGQTGVTTATIIFACILGISCLCLLIYHIVYVVYLLPKRREQEEGYRQLVN